MAITIYMPQATQGATTLLTATDTNSNIDVTLTDTSLYANYNGPCTGNLTGIGVYVTATLSATTGTTDTTLVLYTGNSYTLSCNADLPAADTSLLYVTITSGNVSLTIYHPTYPNNGPVICIGSGSLPFHTLTLTTGSATNTLSLSTTLPFLGYYFPSSATLTCSGGGKK